jgi:hypothetical protein
MTEPDPRVILSQCAQRLRFVNDILNARRLGELHVTEKGADGLQHILGDIETLLEQTINLVAKNEA